MSKNYCVLSPKGVQVEASEFEWSMLKYLNTLTPEEAQVKLQEHFDVLQSLVKDADQYEQASLIKEFNDSEKVYNWYAARYTIKESASSMFAKALKDAACAAASSTVRMAKEARVKMAQRDPGDSPLRGVTPTKTPGVQVPKLEVPSLGELAQTQDPNCPFGKNLS